MDMTSRRTRVSGAHHHARLTTCGAIVRSAAVLLASPAAGDGAPEVNLLSASDGARIVAVSSNFGGAADDETWGAGSAVDGKSRQRLVLGRRRRRRLHRDRAGGAGPPARRRGLDPLDGQRLGADLHLHPHHRRRRDPWGPSTLADAVQAYRSDIDVTSSSLRFDVVSSNGGNTGLVEFAAFGTLLDQ